MIELTMDELRESQMKIMDYVDAFCRNNGINYSLDGGTLLGAVRHKGFIPWDDDVDIMMTRDEYIRFTDKWNAAGNHPFVLSNEETGNSLGYPFGKIHDPHTVTFLGSFETTGVFVDVFPIDKVVDDEDFESRRKPILDLHKDRIVALRCLQANSGKTSLLERLKLFRVVALRCLQANNGDISMLERVKLFYKKSRRVFYECAGIINTIAKSKNSNEATWCYDLVSSVSAKKLIPAKILDEYRDIPFEDRTYRAVVDYDTYLTCLYGDYMTPPPPEKQIAHHGFKAYWK